MPTPLRFAFLRCYRSQWRSSYRRSPNLEGERDATSRRQRRVLQRLPPYGKPSQSIFCSPCSSILRCYRRGSDFLRRFTFPISFPTGRPSRTRRVSLRGRASGQRWCGRVGHKRASSSPRGMEDFRGRFEEVEEPKTQGREGWFGRYVLFLFPSPVLSLVSLALVFTQFTERPLLPPRRHPRRLGDDKVRRLQSREVGFQFSVKMLETGCLGSGPYLHMMSSTSSFQEYFDWLRKVRAGYMGGRKKQSSRRVSFTSDSPPRTYSKAARLKRGESFDPQRKIEREA